MDGALLETINSKENLIPPLTYLLQVQGDSMIDAGINPGDGVLVKRPDEAKGPDNTWAWRFHRDSDPLCTGQRGGTLPTPAP